jgi:hypothetical protein
VDELPDDPGEQKKLLETRKEEKAAQERLLVASLNPRELAIHVQVEKNLREKERLRQLRDADRKRTPQQMEKVMKKRAKRESLPKKPMAPRKPRKLLRKKTTSAPNIVSLDDSSSSSSSSSGQPQSAPSVMKHPASTASLVNTSVISMLEEPVVTSPFLLYESPDMLDMQIPDAINAADDGGKFESFYNDIFGDFSFNNDAPLFGMVFDNDIPSFGNTIFGSTKLGDGKRCHSRYHFGGAMHCSTCGDGIIDRLERIHIK